jgi:LysM repeat protein
MIVAVHVAVIGSVVMTQGCVSTRTESDVVVPAPVETAPVPPMPPSADVVPVAAPAPVAFPVLQPPVPPAPVKTSVAAENVYVVKPGDSLSKIAAAHGVKTAELKELNNVVDVNKIRVGQKLILPDYSKPSSSQPAEKSAKSAEAKATASGDAYVVKPGDALSKIAAAHGVKTKDLMAANNLTDANKIRAGQKLVIPGAKKAEKSKKRPSRRRRKRSPSRKPRRRRKKPRPSNRRSRRCRRRCLKSRRPRLPKPPWPAGSRTPCWTTTSRTATRSKASPGCSW